MSSCEGPYHPGRRIPRLAESPSDMSIVQKNFFEDEEEQNDSPKKPYGSVKRRL